MCSLSLSMSTACSREKVLLLSTHFRCYQPLLDRSLEVLGLNDGVHSGIVCQYSILGGCS